MAEKAVHVSSITHPSASAFEVSAAESLEETLNPALETVLLFFAPYNTFVRKLIKYYHEIFLFLHYVLQRHYLNNHSATFSEQVYGLKRVNKNGTNVTQIDEKHLTLFLVVLLPYLRIKAEQQRNKYRLDLADGNIQNSFEKVVKQTACFSIETAEVAWRLWAVKQLLQYMSGESIHQTPELQLQNQQLVYTPNSNQTTSLEFLAFLIQFLSSWWTDTRASTKQQLPNPPPPRYHPRSIDLKGKCGICLQRWVVPTAISVSGYVFCFRCIIQHFQNDESCCPITKIPANVQHLIRVYN